jgi:stearoyl-CoA desaturase (Delta-9 desaturase)
VDLLTPAQTWARKEADAGVTDAVTHEDDHLMPWPQQVTMFLSSVGPIVGLVLAIVLLWRHGPGVVGWPQVLVMLGMYALAGFGVTIGFHRLLTHKAFDTYRPVRLALAIIGSIAAQGAVIRWCATHRRHHQVSDREGDPHSPHLHGDSSLGLLRGMWHAHMGWLFRRDVSDSARSVPDLLEDRAMLLIDRLYFFWVFFGIVLPGAIVGLWTQSWAGFFSGMIWGGVVRICLLQHVTWSINSICHVWGKRPFKSGDHSTNNWLCAILALGEGWHNNHHAFPTSARHGLRWWQFDSSYLIIRTMGLLGLAKNIRTPSPTAMDAKSAHA